MEEEESNTQYFLNLEKKNVLQNAHLKPKPSDSKEASHAKELLKLQKTFYQQLYSKAPSCTKKYNFFFDDPDLSKLDDQKLPILKLFGAEENLVCKCLQWQA